MPATALAEGLALKEQGNKLFKDGEYMKAIKQYKKGILRTRGLVARTAAMAMFALGRGTEPLSEEQEAELVRLTQSLHANLSACYLKLSEWDKAVRYAAVVLDSDPGNVKSMLRLGQAYNQLGDLVG
jgi:FK506-binding protein 8